MRLLNRKGFSLLELMAVLFLIGLIAGLTTPMLMSSLDRITNQSDVRKITSSLRYARTRAIAEKTPFSFMGNIDRNDYRIKRVSDDEASRIFKLGANVRFTHFADDMESLDQGKFAIVFFPQGNSTGGEIQLETLAPEDENQIQFFITLDKITGKTRLQEKRQ